MKQQIMKVVKHEAFIQLIKYGLVGGVGLVVDIGIFTILVKVLHVNFPFAHAIASSSFIAGMTTGLSVLSVNAATSHVISSIIAIVNNFILNRKFTFNVKDKKYKRFFLFFLVAIIGLVFSTALLFYLNHNRHMDPMIAKIIATLVIAVLQFVVNKLITFKKK